MKRDYFGRRRDYFDRSSSDQVPAIPEDPEPLDFIIADAFKKARHHALEVCGRRHHTGLERAGHFATSLRRALQAAVYSIEPILFTQIATLLSDASIWKDVGVLQFPYRVYRCKQGDFLVTAERIERWKYLTEDEQAKACDEIDETLGSMKRATANMEFHAQTAKKANTDGERVLDNLAEALESANV